MTIKEFAKSKGITPQAVYQKMRAAEIKLSSIKKENSNELTKEGVEIISKLFTKENKKFENKQEELLKEIEDLKKENNFLKEQLEEARRAKEEWRQAASDAERTAQQAQALHLAELQRLPAPAEKRSLWARLTRKK